MAQGLSRRHFFFGGLLASAVPAGGYGTVPSLKALGYKSPNEKLNVASIGAGGRPALVLTECETQNIVALADVDWERGAEGFAYWAKAAKYKDYRVMLDQSGNDIDAVVVGTPDHMHAACALACMQAGKHVYVEKPLTRTAWEARFLRKAARKYGVATQMGNQGYSHDATRVACEILWSGEIGDVTEVHAWIRPAIWPQGMRAVAAPSAIPETLDWDLWLGCAAERPFTAGDEGYRQFASARAERIGRLRIPPRLASTRAQASVGQDESAPRPRGGGFDTSRFGFYLPFNWRGFHDFGSGLIGDWGIHILGPANWGLQLGPESLVSVECVHKDSSPPFTFPDELTLRYDFAARRNMPPVSVYWYNTKGDAYLPEGMTAEAARKIDGQGPQVGPARGGRRGGGFPRSPQGSGYNCIFVGSKGYLGTNGRGEDVGLLPGSRWADYKLPTAYLSRSPGASTGSNTTAHVNDWIRACKGGAPACSNFDLAAPFTEWLVLGAAAVHYGGKLMWDNDSGEFMNNKDANRWVKPRFRKEWKLRM